MEKIDYQKHYFPGTRIQLLAKLKASLGDGPRFEHCLRVEQTAIYLAKKNNGDVEAASVAGLVHDYAKKRSAAEFKKVIETKGLDSNLLNWGNFIWHGEVGAEIIKDELGITNQQILNAVRRHTIGAAEMTLLDKIIYVADYIEPGRVFPGVAFARKIADQNLNDAVSYETKNTLQYLMQSNQMIYPPAILTYNRWVAGK